MTTWLQAGDLVARRYRLLDRIGTGGMATIWRARDEVLDRLVAIKVLDPELSGDGRLRELARREAWAVARVDHPDVAGVHDFLYDTTDNGHEVAVIVLELVDGEPLADRIASGPLPWREAARIGARVADVLAAAHAQGVVHRDITPDNILVAGAGRGRKVTVLDFGIAARVGEPDDDTTGASFGTPAYVAPERLDGTPAQAPTDTYALGVVLFEMLTGRMPYPVRGWDDVAVDPGPPPKPGGRRRPRALARLVRQCLARDPAQRPSAEQAAGTLSKLATRRSAHRIGVGAGAGVAVLAVAWALTTGGWLHGADPPSASPSSPSSAPATSPAISTPRAAAPVTVDGILAWLATAEANGQVRGDVALDLRQLLRAWAADDGGATGLAVLQEKVATREREGTLAPDLARQLQADLSALRSY